MTDGIGGPLSKPHSGSYGAPWRVGRLLTLTALSCTAILGCKQQAGQGHSAKQGEQATVGTDTQKYRLIGMDNHIIQARTGVDRICDRLANCVVKRRGSGIYIQYAGKSGETWVFIPLSHTINFDAAQQSAVQSDPLKSDTSEANLSFDGTPDAMRIDLYEGAIQQHVPTGSVRFDFPTTAQ